MAGSRKTPPLPAASARNAATFEVDPGEAHERLDRVLASRLRDEGLSREKIKKLITGGKVTRNGRPERSPKALLREGDRLLIELPESASGLAPEEGELTVIYRDAVLAVLDKPAGLTVHPAPGRPTGTLAHRLLAHFPELARQEGFRPGIVHRLDKDTSGLMIAALTEKCRLLLAAMFARQEVRKEYLALVHGVPEWTERIIEAPVGRHPQKKTLMCVTEHGKSAKSAARVLFADPLGRFSLLAVRIFSGRTHQVRVHMQHLGHPLWGDALYKKAPDKHADARPWGDGAPERQMLHAWKLAFRHPLPEEAGPAFSGDREKAALPILTQKPARQCFPSDAPSQCDRATPINTTQSRGQGGAARVVTPKPAYIARNTQRWLGRSCFPPPLPPEAIVSLGTISSKTTIAGATNNTLQFTCPPPADFTAAARYLSRRTLHVVITGSPGCGKSTLLALLREAGLPVFSADAEVAALYAPGGDAQRLFRAQFGERFVPDEKGPVDKAALGAAMRADPALRREVEALVHPLVWHALESFRRQREMEGASLSMAEIPLYLESGRQRRENGASGFAPVLVGVHCPFAVREERLRARGWSPELIAEMESWQWPEEKKMSACELVLDNSETRASFAREAAQLPGRLEALARRREDALLDELKKLWEET